MVAAVLLGVVTLGAVVMTLQQVSVALWPLPEGLDPFDPAHAEAWTEYLQSMPRAAWLLAMTSEVAGAFCGAVVAGSMARDARKNVAGIVVGLGLALSVANWVSFRHPVWFVVGQIVLYPSAYLAAGKMLAGWGPVRRGRAGA